ncbi:MAG: FliM/FliN family flagellar motor switch protein, partial [Clostridium sp.]
ELDTLDNQEVEILVNEKKIAYGQVVVAQQNFGIKITKVLEPEDLVKTLK